MVFDFVFGNALRFDLPSEFLDSVTTLDVPSSVASDVASALVNGGRMPFVLADSATITPNTTIEIVYATSANTSNNTLTVTRAREGTAPATWPAGTVAQNSVTAGVMGALSETNFQSAFIEAEALLDATSVGNEVQLIIPAGFRFWPTRLQVVLVNTDASSSIFPAFRWGTTSGGTDIVASSSFPSSNTVNDRGRLFLDNEETARTGTTYVGIAADAASSTKADFKVIGEGVMEGI